MTLSKSTLLVGAAALGLAACTTPEGQRNNTGTGALIGAGLGAAIGSTIADSDRTGAIIGGVVGAGLGGAIGNQLDKQQQALEQEIGGSGARIVNTGDRLIVSLPEAITFATESATVRPDIRDDILAIARNLQEYPNNTVQVIGHTDNTGTDAFNQGLSERRASAVANILLSGGVPSFRIVAFGVGESQPIATNGTPEGRQANRRVEIVITPTGQS